MVDLVLIEDFDFLLSIHQMKHSIEMSFIWLTGDRLNGLSELSPCMW